MTRVGKGFASAGPRARTLDRAEVLARREALLAQPSSPERSKALTTVRCQLRSIDRREGYAE